MKIFWLVCILLVSGNVSAETLNSNHPVVVCVKKRRGMSPNSYSLMKLHQPRNYIYFENSAGGQEIDPIVAKSVVGTKLVVQVKLGTLETVTFDLQRGVANWVEDEYPTNTELYPFCRSFPVDDFDAIKRWFTSVQQSPRWVNGI